MTESNGPATIRNPRVLIVDDDASVREALSSLLVPRLEPVFQVEVAASGREALEIVEAETPGEESLVALVISDERMPGMSGNDLLVTLRHHALHRHGGRILVTGYSGLPSAKRAINEAEVDKYYPKPWDADGALLPAVGEILAKFARSTGLDSVLVSAEVAGTADLTDVRRVRRDWWLYVNYLGDEPQGDEAEDIPDFVEPEDESATHVLLHRRGPEAEWPAATVRLREKGNGRAHLDRLAFRPEESNDATEALLLRAALLRAQADRFGTVSVEAPSLRREVYESVRFRAGTPEGDEPSSRAIAMSCNPAAAIGAPFARRYERENRLCGCLQTGCPARDYDRERRGYYCPLDVREGRLPPGFPGRGARRNPR